MTMHGRRTKAAVAAGLACAVVLAGCSSKGEEASEGSGGDGVKHGVGVTDSTITLGAIGDLSGPFAAADTAIINAQVLYFDKVNKAGGVCGRSIEVDVVDAGYDVQKATVAYSEQEREVLGFAQIFGSAISAALADRYETDKVLLYPAGQSGRTAQLGGVLQIGVTYDYEIINLLDQWLDEDVISEGDTIAHIGLVGDYGDTAIAGSTHVAKERDLTLKATSVPPTAVDMTAQVTNARADGADAILISGTPKQVASVAAASQAAGLDVPLGISTAGWSNDLLDGNSGKAIEERAWVGAPNADLAIDTPEAAELMTEFKAKHRDDADDFKQLSAFSASKAITSVLKQACKDGDLTRAGLLAARKKLTAVDFSGMVPTLDFSKTGVLTTESFVMRPDRSVPGLLKSIDRGIFAGPDAETYTSPFAS